MQRSTDRIITTHAGSLPRPAELLDVVLAEGSQAFDRADNAGRLKRAVADIVRRQVELGIDVVDDGEYSKSSFVSYINERIGGIELDPAAPQRPQWRDSREGLAFPEFYAATHPRATTPRAVCTQPLAYKGMPHLRRDIENLKAALKENVAPEAFMPAISPANVEDWILNRHYKTQEEFLFAIADVLHEEYRTIVEAGFLLQIDDPRLVTYYVVRPESTIEECRKWAELRVEAMNHALRGISADKVRHHTCYGINMGPRVHDMEMKDIVDIILKIRAGAYSFEAANPRHEHEWRIWETAKLPDEKALIPGVISHSTVLVEHPELVAERIGRFAKVVGRERVIAGADCGFATFAGSKEVHPSIVWAKFEALSQGAEIASKRLWGRGA